MKLIRPAQIRGRVEAPASKSATQRALALACVIPGESHIANASDCDDSLAMLAAIQVLGARVTSEGRSLRIIGGGRPIGSQIDCRESALCMRMLAPIAALYDRETTLTGTGSLIRRPVDMTCAPILALGGSCQSDRKRPPLVVRGPMKGGSAELDASVTSQVLSGLLVALPSCAVDSVLQVRQLASREYVNLTLRLMERAGLQARWDPGMTRFEIPGRQVGRPFDLEVEGDWSGAASLLVAGAIAGEVEVAGLDPHSTQPDRQILTALERAGARVTVRPGEVRVEQDALEAFDFDVTDCPDLLPAAVALAVHCKGRSRFTGVARTRFKESDRRAVIATELGKLGASVELGTNTLVVSGGRLAGGAVETHGDHRIAMAAAVAALRATGEVRIRGSECVAKSYPGFFEDLELLVVG